MLVQQLNLLRLIEFMVDPAGPSVQRLGQAPVPFPSLGLFELEVSGEAGSYSLRAVVDGIMSSFPMDLVKSFGIVRVP